MSTGLDWRILWMSQRNASKCVYKGIFRKVQILRQCQEVLKNRCSLGGRRSLGRQHVPRTIPCSGSWVPLSLFFVCHGVSWCAPLYSPCHNGSPSETVSQNKQGLSPLSCLCWATSSQWFVKGGDIFLLTLEPWLPFPVLWCFASAQSTTFIQCLKLSPIKILTSYFICWMILPNLRALHPSTCWCLHSSSLRSHIHCDLQRALLTSPSPLWCLPY